MAVEAINPKNPNILPKKKEYKELTPQKGRQESKTPLILALTFLTNLHFY